MLVDEAQFLDPNQVDNLMKIVVELDIPVICYGLRTDFRTQVFPGSHRLLSIAHSLEELKTVCKCTLLPFKVKLEGYFFFLFIL